MDSTISLSKGCFVFKNGATRADKTKKITKRKHESICDHDHDVRNTHHTYSKTWHKLQAHIGRLQEENYSRTLQNIVNYINKERLDDKFGENILPTAALLTGINQPDHLIQFKKLSQLIYHAISASVCVLESRDCATIKSAVEAMVYNFIELHESEDDRDSKRLRRSQCNLKQLEHWYHNNFPKKLLQNERSTSSKTSHNLRGIQDAPKSNQDRVLVVILPDFECFNSNVLQDFILILSSYRSKLPFVLILGVATGASAVHSTLSFHVTCKLKLCVFQTQAAVEDLNEMLHKVILSPQYPFHLSGKALKFLTHIFLYYDFSKSGFIQGYKYCLMEHFYQGNAYALCSNYSDSLTKIRALTHADMETIRKLLSFRPFVENINDCKRIIAILTDDDYLKKKLPQLLRACHIHFMLFRTFLELLTVLVEDLPKSPLGKHRRELYVICLSREVAEQAEFNECWQVLSFMSKDEFVEKISKAIEATQRFFEAEISQLELASDCEMIINEKLNDIKKLLSNVIRAGVETESQKEKNSSPNEFGHVISRHDLKDKLLQMSKQNKPISEFTKSVSKLLKFIQTDIVECHLVPLQRAPPLHELFVFTDISTVRRNIIGAPRAALHMALNNPHFYLQCKCCRLSENTQLLSTLPDLSIAYKLHLECGRMINLFDWLQAFQTIVDFNSDENQDQVNPLIQASFTRALAELQFLGYIKMSKRKMDHATRLTW